MVQKALVIALEHHARVGDAGVDHAAEDEVDNAVAPRKGNGGGHAVGRQLPQVVVLLVGEDDSMQSFHLDTSLWSRLSIELGRTVSPGPMAVPGPRTVTPHFSGSQFSGFSPTTAPASTVQFSPRMA